MTDADDTTHQDCLNTHVNRYGKVIARMKDAFEYPFVLMELTRRQCEEAGLKEQAAEIVAKREKLTEWVEDLTESVSLAIDDVVNVVHDEVKVIAEAKRLAAIAYGKLREI